MKNNTFDWYNEKYTLSKFIKETMLELIYSDSDEGKRLMGDSGWKYSFIDKLAQNKIIEIDVEPCCKEFCEGDSPCHYNVARDKRKQAKLEFEKLLDKMKFNE